jgi:SAM-dependent methyltransferase
VNDSTTVAREYATEERFLARRLTTWAHLLGRRVEDAMTEALAEASPRRVLEVGSGTGDLSVRVRETLGVDYVATDLSARMAALTGQRGIAAAIADIQQLPFGDASFDAVLANRVLYHLPDLNRGLREIARALRPRGRLVVVTYGREHLSEFFALIGERRMASMDEAAALAAVFPFVERRDLAGVARFETHEALLGMAAQSFGDENPPDVSTHVRAAKVPCDATFRHTVFIAYSRI